MRTDFSSTSLVRLLGDWTPVDPPAQGMDFAERLSLWLDTFDAIGLQSAHQAIRSTEGAAAAVPAGRGRRARPAPGADALAQDLQRVRAALAHAIAQDLPPEIELPLDERTRTAANGYARWHQRHQVLQRQMEQMIAPLRDHVRQALAQGPARLRQLATLDAALEAVLAKREQQLLPALGALLQRRFAQVQAQGEPLEAFAQDWRQALLAEVDLRLEPVAGLVEALGTDNETT